VFWEAFEILMHPITNCVVNPLFLVGLAHLHGGSARPIVHCDIKTTNILLSEDMVAKVADFGVSKLILEPDASHVLTRVKGTFGYIDPMYVSKRDLHPLSI
jgi:serine/threonine protein kinase